MSYSHAGEKFMIILNKMIQWTILFAIIHFGLSDAYTYQQSAYHEDISYSKHLSQAISQATSMPGSGSQELIHISFSFDVLHETANRSTRIKCECECICTKLNPTIAPTDYTTQTINIPSISPTKYPYILPWPSTYPTTDSTNEIKSQSKNITTDFHTNSNEFLCTNSRI
eukprot:92148_1